MQARNGSRFRHGRRRTAQPCDSQHTGCNARRSNTDVRCARHATRTRLQATPACSHSSCGLVLWVCAVLWVLSGQRQSRVHVPSANRAGGQQRARACVCVRVQVELQKRRPLSDCVKTDGQQVRTLQSTVGTLQHSTVPWVLQSTPGTSRVLQSTLGCPWRSIVPSGAHPCRAALRCASPVRAAQRIALPGHVGT